MTLASIPSPSTGTIDLGPFVLHMYGLMLLLAIAACIGLTGIRWKRRGGEWDLVMRTAVWGVAFGVIGARLYHDVTSWDQVPNPKWKGIFEVWQGGLGIWGGILLGCLAGAVVVHRAGVPVRNMLDAAAPGLLLAQAIGRWGNWWNQELFGKPTGQPWGLEIKPEHRPGQYGEFTTFHPTFLYEFVYCLIGVVVLLLLDRKFKFRPPALFALYISIYTFGRVWEEFLRVDPSHHVFGLRLNAVVAVVVFIASTAFFVWWQFLHEQSKGGSTPAVADESANAGTVAVAAPAPPAPPVSSSRGPGAAAKPAAAPKRGFLSRRRRAAAEKKAPKMAIPKGRVRPPQ